MIFNARPCTYKQVNKYLFCDHALPLTFAHISSFHVFQLSWSFPLSFSVTLTGFGDIHDMEFKTLLDPSYNIAIYHMMGSIYCCLLIGRRS